MMSKNFKIILVLACILLIALLGSHWAGKLPKERGTVVSAAVPEVAPLAKTLGPKGQMEEPMVSESKPAEIPINTPTKQVSVATVTNNDLVLDFNTFKFGGIK